MADGDGSRELLPGHYYMDSSYRGLWKVDDRTETTVTLRDVDGGTVTVQATAPVWCDGGRCEGTGWFGLPDGGNVRVSAERHVGGPGHAFATFRNRRSYRYCALYMGDPVEKVTARGRRAVWRDPWDHSAGTVDAECVKLKGSGYHRVYRDESGDEEIWLGEFRMSARDEVAV